MYWNVYGTLFETSFVSSVPIRLLTSKMSETEIYFCGSIRAGRDDVGLYAKIVDKLAAFGKVRKYGSRILLEDMKKT